jgi:hypothetical protein
VVFLWAMIAMHAGACCSAEKWRHVMRKDFLAPPNYGVFRMARQVKMPFETQSNTIIFNRNRL